MVTLALDTSHPQGRVALAREGAVCGSLEFGTGSSHLAEVGSAVDELLRRHEIRVNDVDRMALVIGPGSFTGLRIGLAFTKGLYAALGLEVVSVGTLELIAQPLVAAHEFVGVMVDARKDEVYAAVYRAARKEDELETVVEPRVCAPEAFLRGLETSPLLLVGSGAIRYGHDLRAGGAAEIELADAASAAPPVEYLSGLAGRLRPLSREEVLALEPRYMRPSDAKLKALGPVNPASNS